MTKINKLGKSTFVIAILSFILVAVLAFGGTYAYFSATAGKAAGELTTGHLSLTIDSNTGAVKDINGFTADETIVQPGQLIIGQTADDGTESGSPVVAAVDSNIRYFIRVRFDVDVTTDSTTHDGVMDDNDTVDDADDVHDTTLGQGDNVGTNHYEILTITVKGDFDATATTEWNEIMLASEGGAAADAGTVRSGYFYPAYPENGDAADGFAATRAADALTTEAAKNWNLSLLVNISDWVGAYGCTYYMDAEISVKFQVEVLQADFLNVDGTTTKDDDYANNVELHNAWDKAVALSQPVNP